MRILVQRVKWAQVEVNGAVVGRIEHGLLIYVGVATGDSTADAARAADKIAHLRIFDDENGKLNLSVQDVRGGVLAIPNFTLMADAAKGRRPAFVDAARGETARSIFASLLAALESLGVNVLMGVFGAHMEIRSDADGPVNVVLDIPDKAARKATRMSADTAN